MPENRSREYQSSVSGGSPVGRQRSKSRLAEETQRARPSETNRAAPGRLAQNPVSSSLLPNDWRHRTRKISDAQCEGRLSRVNCRLCVVTSRKRGGEIAFRTHNLGICAQSLLVRFEH